jgi:hypothetical protein
MKNEDRIVKARRRNNEGQTKFGTKTAQMKKRDFQYSVTIDATFGSEIQHTVGMRLLDQFLATWKDEAESRHKKNSITIIQGSEFASVALNNIRRSRSRFRHEPVLPHGI